MPHSFYEEEKPAVKLPHPPISLVVFLVVEEAIRVAWEQMRTTPRAGFDLPNAHEDVVTQELYEVLYDEIFGKGVVPGFDNELLTTVTRESKVRNYDGTKLDKMPDLLVGLVDRPPTVKRTQDWLYIECKPVDSDHATGVHYCDKGIIRFIRGEYAWAMTSALMVAYVHSDYTILPKLSDALDARKGHIPTLNAPTPCRRSQVGTSHEPVHWTLHGRTFTYRENGLPAPPITLRHLWLRRN